MSPHHTQERSQAEPDLLAAVEMERRRIAQDLHDGLGQQLTGISFLLKVLHKNCSEKDPAGERDLLEAERMIRESICQTRNLSLSLCPASPAPQSLMGSFEELASRTEATYPVRCSFRGGVASSPLSPARGLELLTLVQEGIVHAVRDRRAGRISIAMQQDGPGIRLTVQSDGRENPGETGLDERMRIRIMELRAQRLGAELLMERTASGQTLLSCFIRNRD
jgi:signal transduction histidine kinase